MPWMTRRVSLSLSLLVIGSGLATTGCGPNAKDQKIAQLTSENQQLKDELAERERQFNDAVVRENEARGTIDELNRELAKLRGGEKVAQKGGDGWVTMPSFDMISVPGSVLFASGKADVTSAGKSMLSRIASDIKSRYPDRDIYVFGHTDNDPIRRSKFKDNWELGAMRSLNVVRTLRDMGIPNDNLVQANCGEYRPRGSKAESRRVEFYAVRHGSSVNDNSSARAGESD